MRTPIALLIAALAVLPCIAAIAGDTEPDPRSLLAAPVDGIALYDKLRQAEALFMAGKFAEAEPLYDAVVAGNPLLAIAVFGRAEVKRRLGHHDEAIEGFRRAIELQGPGVPGHARYMLAATYAAKGDRKAALDTLAVLIADDHFTQRPDMLTDPDLKPLHDDPRFRQLAGEVAVRPASRAEGWRGDLDYLVAELKRNDPVYHDTPLPAKFEQLRRRLHNDIPKLNDEQVYVRIGQLLASLEHGHTNLWQRSLPGGLLQFTQLPLQFYAFPEGVFVVGAEPPQQGLIGSELVRIETTPAFAALRMVGGAQGKEGPMEVLWTGVHGLGLAQTLRGLGIAPRADRIQVTLRRKDGTVEQHELAPVPVKAARPPKLPPAPDAAPPLFLKNVARAHWAEPLPELRAVYVQFNRVADTDDETLAAFGIRLRQVLADAGAVNLIVDLRHNGGGNSFEYVELLRTLIGFSAKAGNRLYVLIGRGVYSAAGNFSTDLERLADPVFVGEPTSMTGNNYGDSSALRLPYSGLGGGLASVRWQLSHPWDRRVSIVPQVPVALTAADWAAGRDPVLGAVRTLISR